MDNYCCKSDKVERALSFPRRWESRRKLALKERQIVVCITVANSITPLGFSQGWIPASAGMTIPVPSRHLTFSPSHHLTTSPSYNFCSGLRPLRQSGDCLPLQHLNTPTPQHSNTPTLQHSSTPALQHSSTPTPQHPKDN